MTIGRRRQPAPGAVLALAALAIAFAAPSEAASARRDASGAIRYYDDAGFDRGYAWCLKSGGRQLSGTAECRYATYAQCRIAIVNPPGGDCEPNPFAAQAGPEPRVRR